MRKSVIINSLLAAIPSLFSCENHDLSRVPPDGDYLPATVTRHFLREQFADPNELSTAYYDDTIRIDFVRDTIIAGNTYHQINHFSNWDSGSGIIEVNDFYMFYRREGSRYLAPPWHNGEEEHVFLDTDKPVGTTWEYQSPIVGDWLTTHKIKDIHSVWEVNGIQYHNVIEIETETKAKDHQGSDYLISLVRTYYAKGHGEIYKFSGWYTYPVGLRLSAI